MTNDRVRESRLRFEQGLIQRMNRRRLLTLGGTAAIGVAVSVPNSPTRSFAQDSMGTPIASPDITRIASAPTFAATPFSLGVASGDPLPDGVVLWTRLAVAPRDGGGMDPFPYDVRWELASDDSFNQIVQSGTATASPALAHSIHVDVTGLDPATEYFYRFMVAGEESPIGRTLTAPASDAQVDELRFAFTSCAHYEHGFFNAYRTIAEGNYDLIFGLGDYIYEMGPGEYAAYGDEESPRRFTGAELIDLAHFRNRHALYKTDADLQAAHASAPWVVAFDDHETENDYAGLIREDPKPQEPFPALVAASYQA